MLIDILPISHRTGDFLELELAPGSAELDLDQQDDAVFSAVTFSGRIENTGKGSYRLDGRLHATLTEPCARCLAPVTSELSADLAETYQPGSVLTNTGLDEEGYRYEGHVIDIRQALHDNVLLYEPLKLLCSPDCRGLCPVCGQNLNLGHCTCGDDHPQKESPFSQLKQLLQD